MEYTKQLIDTSRSMEENIIELIQSTDDVPLLARLIEREQSIQLTLSSGDWIISIGKWDEPSLVIYQCNNNPCLNDIENYIKECGKGLDRLKDEAKVEGDSFAEALQNILIEDVETGIFYSAITVTKRHSLGSGIIGYYDKPSMERAVINAAHNFGYDGFEFDEYASKDEALREYEGRLDEDDEDDPNKEIIDKIKALNVNTRIVVYEEHFAITVEAWSETSEIDWARTAISHDLQSYDYIILASK